MKLKYIIAPLLAVLTLFTACNEDQELASLNQISVSKSMVALPLTGGRDTVVIKGQYIDYTLVNSSDAVVKLGDSDYPSWLNISVEKAKDKKGQEIDDQYNMIFVADATEKVRKPAYLLLNTPKQTQRIMVLQGVQGELPLSTCAQVLAGPDGDTYKVKGTVTKITQTTYGNWYLNDGTGEVYIYGTLDKKGNTKNFASLGIEIGDEVTVQGPKTTYGSTVELIDVSVVNIKKSIVKVDSVMVNAVKTDTLPKAGGEVIAYLTNKGEGVDVKIPEEAESWLSIKSINTKNGTSTVVFKANANNGGDRVAEVSFTSTSGSNSSTVTKQIVQLGAIIECPISEFLASKEDATVYRLTGVITKVAKAEYGNIYIRDYTGEAYVYGIGNKGDFEKLGLKVGDIVTLTGTHSSFNGKPQVKGGKYEKHKAVTKISAADFVKLKDDKQTYYMLTGTITTAGNGNKTELKTYGNFDLVDETGAAYIYGVQTGWENTPENSRKHFSDLGKKLGDEITVIGYKTSYNNKAQMGGAFYFEPKK